MESLVWADRGQVLQQHDVAVLGRTCRVGVARLGSVQMEQGGLSVWLQLRGSAWIEAREGRFRLRRGEWLVFDKESRPMLQSDRHGLCIGLHLAPEALQAVAKMTEGTLFAGRGRMSRRDARIALRLWREAPGDGEAITTLRPLLLHLMSFQRDLSGPLARCPGRSRLRKRQVFGRLQRARLYLEGNSDRVVRLSELAELTSFSNWYFSKTFQSLYQESPQAAAARLRIERAARLLRDTSMMIGEVAAACGFDNCCSFARAFRARHGVSASHYRKSIGTVVAARAG